MVGANLAKKTGIAVNLLPRPTYISTATEMLRPLAPASGLPAPPSSAQPSEVSPAADAAIAISPAVLNGAVDAAVSTVPAVVVDVKAPASSSTPGRRQFTWEDEAVLVELWKKYISEYFNGVRKRVLEKMTDELNAKFSAPPHFTVKQVNNKLHYMERRYRSLLDEFRNSGTPISATDVSVSVRASIERKFSLFYVVHDVLREVVETPHPLTPVAAAPITTMATLAGGTTMQNRSNATGAGDMVTMMPDGMAVDGVDGLPAAGNDPMSMAISPSELPDGVSAPEMPTIPTKRTLLLPGNGGGGNGGNSPKRARTNTPVSTAENIPIAARVTGMVNRVVAISERLLTADRNERSERIEAAKRATAVRLKEIDLMEKHAAQRVREERNGEKKTKMEALKFIVQNLNGAEDEEANAMKLRTLRQLETLVCGGDGEETTKEVNNSHEENDGNDGIENDGGGLASNDNELGVSRR